MCLKYRDYYMSILKEILEIDSPVGYTDDIVKYIIGKIDEFGYKAILTKKGDISVCINPESKDDGNSLWIGAHLDTLGGMVSYITDTGRLEISPLGSLSPNNTEAENVKVITRNKKTYEGTFQMKNASSHVNPHLEKETRSFCNMEVVLDEDISNREDVLELGINVGDIVAFDPKTRILDNGFIKSRFLDDKLGVSILLYLAYIFKMENIAIKRRIYFGFTVYEEVGHGGSSIFLPDISEVLSLDMGVVGDHINCTERKVSICVKDSKGPYSYDIVSSMVNIALNNNIDYVLDVYPLYSSDANTAMIAGVCAKHALIGPGVYASHGYERSHIDGVKNTVRLLYHYIQSS